MNTIDEQLMMALRSYLSTLMSVGSSIVVISCVTPMFTVYLIPILIYYGLQQNFFTVSKVLCVRYPNNGFVSSLVFDLQVTYRELKRLDSVNRSPIYALLGESIDGVATIRAYSSETTLTHRLTGMLDVQQVCSIDSVFRF